MAKIIGIDLGTSNSAAAVMEGGKPVIIPSAEGTTLGELVVQDTYGEHRVKLAAGDMVLYPATSRHHVTPVTRGSRVSSFFWIQSMIRDEAARALLYDLDSTIQNLRRKMGETDEAIALTGLYHNLLRRWADT